jgi:predicted Zn-dependent protease
MGDDRGAEADLARAARAGSVEAKALLGAQRGPRDVAAARDLTERHPRKAWTWALYGDALLDGNRPADAATAYRTALDGGLDGPLALAARYNLTVALLRTGETQAAARSFADYRLALGRPLPPDGHYLAGLLAYAQGDHAAAMAEWRGLPEPMRSRVRRVVGDEAYYTGL